MQLREARPLPNFTTLIRRPMRYVSVDRKSAWVVSSQGVRVPVAERNALAERPIRNETLEIAARPVDRIAHPGGHVPIGLTRILIGRAVGFDQLLLACRVSGPGRSNRHIMGSLVAPLASRGSAHLKDRRLRRLNCG